MTDLPWHLLLVKNDKLYDNMQVFFDALEDRCGTEYAEWAKPRLRIWRKLYQHKFHPAISLTWTDEAVELDKLVMQFMLNHIHMLPKRKFGTTLLFYGTRKTSVQPNWGQIQEEGEIVKCRFELGHWTKKATFQKLSRDVLLFGHKPPPEQTKSYVKMMIDFIVSILS